MLIFLKLLQMNLLQNPVLFIYINYFSFFGYIELQKLQKDLKFKNFLSFEEFQDFKVLCPISNMNLNKNKINENKIILKKILNISIQKKKLILIS